MEKQKIKDFILKVETFLNKQEAIKNKDVKDIFSGYFEIMQILSDSLKEGNIMGHDETKESTCIVS